MNGRDTFAGMQSILEIPLFDERFWAKIPSVTADAFMLDLEDSAHPDAKVRLREWLVDALRDGAHFGGRRIFVRVNNLATPWGRDDVAALAAVETPITFCYPKVETAEEMQELVALAGGARDDRGVMVMIETARAIAELPAIARCPGVVGLHFGYSDYAADVGARLYNRAGDNLHEALLGVRAQIAAMAAAFGLFATGGTMIPQFQDLDKVETFVRGWADAGYTGVLILSPRHLDTARRAFAPLPEEVAHARLAIAAFEAAEAQGRPNAIVDGILIADAAYRQARALVLRAEQASADHPSAGLR